MGSKIRTVAERRRRAMVMLAVLAGVGFLLGWLPDAGWADVTLYPYFVMKGTASERRILNAARSSIQRALGADLSIPERIPWPAVRAGVFISLMDGARVRACVGSFMPAEDSLSEALMSLGPHVVSVDMRREPVALEELKDLKLVVSFVGRPEPCSDPFDVDFRREGLKTVVEGRQRLLLPGESRTLSNGIRTVLGIQDPGRAVFERFSVVTLDERSWEESR
ncbi:MAG: AMMECR1 domain-containing protein [Deltaproteobacteria bacterium]|nr:AMMECR1 domain-containing protein [Deltaproteobacteria bacterium]